MLRASATSVLLLSVTPTLAQVPEPAPEVRRFAQMLGSWEGTGAILMAPGAEPMPWTAVSTATSVLGGHWAQDDMRVDTGAPAPLVFRAIYGWDRDRGRNVAYVMSNLGTAKPAELRWLSDSTTIVTSTGEVEGRPYIERSITEWKERSYSFEVHRAFEGEALFLHVHGSFRRSESSTSATAAGSNVTFMAPVAHEMGELGPLLGRHAFAGELQPAPGLPTFEITGKVEARRMFGGSIVTAHVQGDPIAGGSVGHEAMAYLSWDPALASYRHFAVDAMGSVQLHEGRWIDKSHLVFTSADVRHGTPAVERLAFVTRDGELEELFIDRLSGVADPVRMFHAEYTAVPDEGEGADASDR